MSGGRVRRAPLSERPAGGVGTRLAGLGVAAPPGTAETRADQEYLPKAVLTRPCPPCRTDTSPVGAGREQAQPLSLQAKLRNPEIWGDLKGTLTSVSSAGGALASAGGSPGSLSNSDRGSGLAWPAVGLEGFKGMAAVTWNSTSQKSFSKQSPQCKHFCFCHRHLRADRGFRQSSISAVSELPGLHKVFGFRTKHFFLLYVLRNFH